MNRYAQPPSAPGTNLRLAELAIDLWGLAPGAARCSGGWIPALRPPLTTPSHAVDVYNLDASRKLAADPEFLALYDRAIDGLDAQGGREIRVTRSVPHLAGQTIAYFSAEFAFISPLPINAGVRCAAGDHCKEASDSASRSSGVGF